MSCIFIGKLYLFFYFLHNKKYHSYIIAHPDVGNRNNITCFKAFWHSWWCIRFENLIWLALLFVSHVLNVLLIGLLFHLLHCVMHMYGKHYVKFYWLIVVFEFVTMV